MSRRSELVPFVDSLTGDFSHYFPDIRSIPKEKLTTFQKLIHLIVFLSFVFDGAIIFREIENAMYEWGLQDDYQRLLYQAAQHPPASFGFHPNFDYLYSVDPPELGIQLQKTFAEIREYQQIFDGRPLVINVFTILNQAENDFYWGEVQKRLAIVLEWARQNNVEVMVSLGLGGWWEETDHPFEARFDRRTLEAAKKWVAFLSKYSIAHIRPFYEANSPYSPNGIAYGNRDPFFVDKEMSDRYQHVFREVSELIRKYLPNTLIHANVTTAGIGFDEYSGQAPMLSVDMYNNYVYERDEPWPWQLIPYNIILGKRYAYEVGENWLQFYRQRRAEAAVRGEVVECGIGEIGRKYSNAETQFWLKYMIAQYLAEGCSIVMIFDISKPEAEWDWKWTVEELVMVAQLHQDVAMLRGQVVAGRKSP